MTWWSPPDAEEMLGLVVYQGYVQALVKDGLRRSLDIIQSMLLPTSYSEE